ncbi:hypothetical protein KIL84_006291 [Mauremys mutica]|uniref:Uncharacterized protein n=1 Tax=Mauremys mutica TaxID=74926 RepID=A0A9D3X176_9SAUR|nr:hypothetical protein KIL84_006291 [Mauremys mutica]
MLGQSDRRCRGRRMGGREEMGIGTHRPWGGGEPLTAPLDERRRGTQGNRNADLGGAQQRMGAQNERSNLTGKRNEGHRRRTRNGKEGVGEAWCGATWNGPPGLDTESSVQVLQLWAPSFETVSAGGLADLAMVRE